jgi:RNA polymerase sigma-70 factor (ECF subfamily)
MMPPMPEDHGPLIDRARSGDRTAFGRLVEATYDEVAGFIALRIHQREAIDELVQATYVDAWLDLAGFDPERPFTAWLKGIAGHRVLRWQRDRQRALRQIPVDAVEPVMPAVEEDERTGEDLVQLRRCLERLPAEARDLLTARHVQGEGLDALAARIGTSVNALATRLCRWRGSLRTCLQRAGVAP